MTTASGLLGGHAYFLHWGVVQISLANFLVIVLMIVVFVLALLLPFPQGVTRRRRSEDADVQRLSRRVGQLDGAAAYPAEPHRAAGAAAARSAAGLRAVVDLRLRRRHAGRAAVS